MAEVSGVGLNRWYKIHWDDGHEVEYLWAQRFFDNFEDAFGYYEMLEASPLPNGRIHPPLPSHEDDRIWAVCVAHAFEGRHFPVGAKMKKNDASVHERLQLTLVKGLRVAMKGFRNLGILQIASWPKARQHSRVPLRPGRL